MQDEVKVTQADREAAASFMQAYWEADAVRSGRNDNHPSVKAIARHRHQAERETLARMEPVAWQRRRKFALASDPAGKVYQWEQCSAREATGHFEREAGYEYRALYTLPPAPEAGQ